MEALAYKRNVDASPSTDDGEECWYENVLEFTNLPLPQLYRPHDVLIQVAYSDVNPVDLQKVSHAVKSSGKADVRLYNKEEYGDDTPFITGFGGTGVVQAVGEKAPPSLLQKEVCFLANPTRPGSYATHLVVDSRCVTPMPPHVSMRDAACVPVAGCTAYESLAKVGLASDVVLSSCLPSSDGKTTTTTTTGSLTKVGATTTKDTKHKSLLIVGGSGGVGSWCITLARSFHPHLHIVATASSPAHQAWCQTLGANVVCSHDPKDISKTCFGATNTPATVGTMDAIICCTEPTPALFQVLADCIQSYGTICLLVSGKSITNLDLSFCFFKCATVTTETVFTSSRTNFEVIQPKQEMEIILKLLNSQKIKAPISPLLLLQQHEQATNNKTSTTNKQPPKISDKFKNVLDKNIGILHYLSNRGEKNGITFCGKLVLCINTGVDVIFIDMKTSSLLQIPRVDCIEQKMIPMNTTAKDGGGGKGGGKVKGGDNNNVPWKDVATGKERDHLIKLLKKHPKLNIIAGIERRKSIEEVSLQEAENVKKMWGVSLKKRERNKEGEELIFIDPVTESIVELCRKDILKENPKHFTLGNDSGNEIIHENVVESTEREEILQKIRKVLHLYND